MGLSFGFHFGKLKWKTVLYITLYKLRAKYLSKVTYEYLAVGNIKKK